MIYVLFSLVLAACAFVLGRLSVRRQDGEAYLFDPLDGTSRRGADRGRSWSRFGRKGTIAYMAIWLVPWTAVTILVARSIISGEGGVVLICWLILALWIKVDVVMKLVRLIFGKAPDREM